MSNLVRVAAMTALIALIASPALARHAKHKRYHRGVESVYLHNYGPPVWPGTTFSYYDGPTSALCKQSASSYRGQDGRRHPCH